MNLLAPAFADFLEASEFVLEYLADRHDLGLWMVTRTEGNDWIVLDARDHHYNVKSGDVFEWSDSFCSRMVTGDGPMVAPDSMQIAAYREAPIGKQIDIGAYVGIPLTNVDGSLFGTLCAVDPEVQSHDMADDLVLFRCMGRLLSTIIQHDLALQQKDRLIAEYREEANTDHMTGLYNRRGWDQMIEREDERCKRFGSPATVFVLDLDGLKQINDQHGHVAGDELIKRAAGALQHTARKLDIIARLGGDEFGIVAVECQHDYGEELTSRIRSHFDELGIQASIGWASRSARQTLSDAFGHADERMYRDKQSRKASA